MDSVAVPLPAVFAALFGGVATIGVLNRAIFAPERLGLRSDTLVGLALMSFYFFVESFQWFKTAFIDRSVPDAMLVAREEIDSWIG